MHTVNYDEINQFECKAELAGIHCGNKTGKAIYVLASEWGVFYEVWLDGKFHYESAYLYDAVEVYNKLHR
jgi:hypothetical protein